MNAPRPEQEFPEPERYELHEGPFYHFEISRREFVQVLGAGILISVAVPTAFAQRAGRGESSAKLAQRLHLGADGVITVFTSKVEVGQGSRTQLSQAAAEELRVPIDRIRGARSSRIAYASLRRDLSQARAAENRRTTGTGATPHRVFPARGTTA